MNGKWIVDNVAQRSKSFRKCLCSRLTSFSTIHFPFSIHPDKSPFIADNELQPHCYHSAHPDKLKFIELMDNGKCRVLVFSG